MHCEKTLGALSETRRLMDSIDHVTGFWVVGGMTRGLEDRLNREPASCATSCQSSFSIASPIISGPEDYGLRKVGVRARLTKIH